MDFLWFPLEPHSFSNGFLLRFSLDFQLISCWFSLCCDVLRNSVCFPMNFLWISYRFWVEFVSTFTGVPLDFHRIFFHVVWNSVECIWDFRWLFYDCSLDFRMKLLGNQLEVNKNSDENPSRLCKWNSVGHQRKSIENQNDVANQRTANKITGTISYYEIQTILKRSSGSP